MLKPSVDARSSPSRGHEKHHREGLGIPINQAEALRWLEAAERQGVPEAAPLLEAWRVSFASAPQPTAAAATPPAAPPPPSAARPSPLPAAAVVAPVDRSGPLYQLWHDRADAIAALD